MAKTLKNSKVDFHLAKLPRFAQIESSSISSGHEGVLLENSFRKQNKRLLVIINLVALFYKVEPFALHRALYAKIAGFTLAAIFLITLI